MGVISRPIFLLLFSALTLSNAIASKENVSKTLTPSVDETQIHKSDLGSLDDDFLKKPQTLTDLLAQARKRVTYFKDKLKTADKSVVDHVLQDDIAGLVGSAAQAGTAAATTTTTPTTKTTTKSPPPPVPTLPTQFSSVSSFACLETEEVSVIRRWGDHDAAVARAEFVEAEPEGEAKYRARIYNYPTQEVFDIVEEDDMCNTIAADAFVDQATPKDFLLTKSADGRFHLLPPFEFQYFNDDNPKDYVGEKTLHGIPAYGWKATIVLVDPVSTVDIEWWFSKPTAELQKTLPVQTIYKETKDGNSMTYFYDYAEFLDFLQDIETPFQTPSLMFCEDRKSIKKPPRNPIDFSAKIEVVEPRSAINSYNIIEDIQVFVAGSMKLTRLDYIPGERVGDDALGQHPMTVIYDESADITYVQDTVLGNCTVGTTTFDPNENLKNKVRNADEIKDLMNFPAADWIWTGQRVVRGIHCDIWIAKRTDWPKNDKNPVLLSIMEWAWTSQAWHELGHETGPVPVALETKTYYDTDELRDSPIRKTYHWSAYDVGVMLYDTFTAKDCVGKLDHREFSLQFPIKGKGVFDVIIESQHISKLIMTKELARLATISLVRFFDIEFEYLSEDNLLEVTFAILEDPTPEDPAWVTTVAEAAVFIKTAVDAGDFEVSLAPFDVDIDPVTALKGSFRAFHNEERKPWPCTPSSRVPGTDSGIPSIPDTFQVRIEFTQSGMNQTDEVWEYVDIPNNIAATQFFSIGVAGEFGVIYNFNTSELFRYQPTYCEAGKPMPGENMFIGFEEIDGKTHISTTNSIFHFGRNYKEEYMGTTTVRGILAHHWRSCIHVPDYMNVTAAVDYYFADPKWELPDDLPTYKDVMLGRFITPHHDLTQARFPGQDVWPADQSFGIPLKAKWTGIVWDKDTKEPKPLDQTWNFFSFQRGIKDRSVFVVPEMTYCETRKPSKPLPKVPKAFSYKQEMITPKSSIFPDNIIRQVNAWYDYPKKLVRMDYTQVGSSDQGSDTEDSDPIREVHDFYTGIQYRIDISSDSCALYTLPEFGPDTAADGDLADKWKYVRMKNSEEFLELDANYTYVGQRKERGVDVDVWITQRSDWPNPDGQYESTMEWSFLTDKWMDKAGANYEFDSPYKLRIQSHSVTEDTMEQEFIYNFFEFDNREPRVIDFDISPCVSELPRYHLKFAFYGRYWGKIKDHGLLESLYDQVWLALAGSSKTSLLRVQDLEIDYAPVLKLIVVEFVLLDAPPLQGNIKDLPKQKTLSEARDNINDAINKNELIITLEQPTMGDSIDVVAVKNTLKESTPTPTTPVTTTPPATNPPGWKPGDFDATVCTPIPQNESDSQLPKLPKQFEMLVTWTQPLLAKTISLHEWYDKPRDQGRVQAIDSGEIVDQIFNFPTEELYKFTLENNHCEAKNIEDQEELFFGTEVGDDGIAHIASPAGIFHFGKNFMEKYMGIEIVRGIETDHWRACVFAPEWDDTTAVVDWYFSTDKNTMPVGPLEPTVPVKAIWKGTALNKETNVLDNVHHEYDFVQFIPGIIEDEDTIFNTPPMLNCKNRKVTRPPPDPSDTYTAKVETIQTRDDVLLSVNLMQTGEIFIDHELKLTRLDYVPSANEQNHPYGTNPLSIVHDFNSKIAYIQDELQGNCTIKNIDEWDVDVDKHSPGLQMINTRAMWYLDRGNWTYTGTRKVKGIDCDIWIANITDFGIGDYAILEWAFATEDWITTEDQEPHPVALQIKTHLSQPEEKELNMLQYWSGFNEKDMIYQTFDIRECAGVLDHKEFAIRFNIIEKIWQLIINRPNEVKYEFYKALAETTGITPLRFFDIELEHPDEKKILEVTFAILEDPDPIDPTWKTTVEIAAGRIEYAVDNGEFGVQLFISDDLIPINVIAIQGSFRGLDNVITAAPPTDIPLPTPHPVTPGQPDLSVCDPSAVVPLRQTKDIPPFPTLPKTFQADVEWNLLPQKETIQLNEWYDFASNQGKIRMVIQGKEMLFIFDYKTQQIFQIIDDLCLTVDPKNAGKNDLIFGFENDGGTIHIASTSSIWHFGDKYNEVYVGTAEIRGILTQHWRSCVYAPELNNATAVVDWYFTHPQWGSDLGPKFPPVPVRAQWRGTAINPDDNLAHPFQYVYEYSNFLPGLETDKSIFNTPPGVYCKDRKKEKALPSIPEQFSMGIEVIQPRSLPTPVNIIHNAKFWYNFPLKVSRIDYKPVSQDIPDLGSERPMREIQDHKNKIVYTLDLLLGNCSVLPLDHNVDISSVITASKNASVQTPLDFFDLTKYDYAYVGQTPIRDGASVDVWIAQRTDWPPGMDGHYNSTFEWSFLTNDWMDSEGDQIEMNVPMKLHIRAKLNDDPSVKYEQIHNVYAFDDEAPPFWDFDVKACLPEIESRHFTFSIAGNWDKVGIYTMPVKSAVYEVLVDKLNISPMRIDDVEYEATSGGGILVKITLLEKPSTANLKLLVRNTFADEVEETLDEVVANLKKLISSNGLQMVVGMVDEIVVMTALPNSFRELETRNPDPNPNPNPPVPGLSVGAMIGVAIVISALVAAFLTMLINYIALRRSGFGGNPGGAASGTTMTSFTNKMFNPGGNTPSS